jgi:hypothetical protein
MRLAFLTAAVATAACGGSGGDTCAGVPQKRLEDIWLTTFKPAGCNTAGCHDPGSRTVTDGFVWAKDSSGKTRIHDFWLKATTLRPQENTSKPYISAGDPSGSYLYEKLIGPGSGSQVQRMPVGGPYFTSEQLAAVRGWICAGAPEPADVSL